MQPGPDLVGGVRAALALLPRHQDAGRRDTRQAGQSEPLPPRHLPRLGRMTTLDEAVELTRTGDVWLFRGHSTADRIIRTTTNSPVNHVGMALVLDDLPPLLWHAELGQSLPDLWAGKHHRGVQLHDLRDAVLVWGHRYGQRAWLRQLHPDVTPEMNDAVLRSVARLDGTPFPTTAKLAGGWLGGRVPGRTARHAPIETAYCAEVLAMTYLEMGLLPRNRKASFYDPGRFWSGDHLGLQGGYRLGGELTVELPDPVPG